MGAIYTDMEHGQTRTMTVKEWAGQSGINPDTARRTVSRKSGRTVGQLDTLTAAEWQMWKPGKSGTDKTKTRPAPTPRKNSVLPDDAKPAVVKVPPPAIQEPAAQTNRLRRGILYALMGTVAAASVQNMLRVTYDIGGDEFTAVLLTVLFSLAPFLFVLAGMASVATRVLTGVLIVYECFCNFTRIYGGLTGFGHNGNPTRFLGLVTDVFYSGTYPTAKVLAGIMAIIAASVFYAAYNELNKK